MTSEYANKVAVITGGARGFGKAFGAALAERGATVVLVDSDAQEVERAAKTIDGDASGRCIGQMGDVTDESRINELMANVAARFSGIDILINNAGLHSHAYSRPMRELGIDQIRRLFDVNITGTVICTLAALPFMANRAGASILNISSAAAYVGTAYGTSKLAVAGLTISFAQELGPEGIRVNAIAPGLILTDTIRAELPEQMLTQITAQQCLPRSGEEPDVVEAMLYLTSERARFITGETLRLTGGYVAGV